MQQGEFVSSWGWAHFALMALNPILLACGLACKEPARSLADNDPEQPTEKAIERGPLFYDPSAGPAGRQPEPSTSDTSRQGWMPRWQPGDWWVIHELWKVPLGRAQEEWSSRRRKYTVKRGPPTHGHETLLVEVESLEPRVKRRYDLYYEKDRLALTSRVNWHFAGGQYQRPFQVDFYNDLLRTHHPTLEGAEASPVFPLRARADGQEEKQLFTFSTCDERYGQWIRMVPATEWMKTITESFPEAFRRPTPSGLELIDDVKREILATCKRWPKSTDACYRVELGSPRQRGGKIEREILQLWCPGFTWPIYAEAEGVRAFLEQSGRGN